MSQPILRYPDLIPGGRLPVDEQGPIIFSKPELVYPQNEVVQWAGRHIELHPKWHQVEKVCKIVGAVLLSLSAVAALATVATAFLFTAAPLAVWLVNGALGAATLALFISGTVFLSKSAFWEDPAFRVRKGQEYFNLLATGKATYNALRASSKIYEEMTHFQVLTADDINKALRQDAFSGNFKEFYKCHSSFEAFDPLNQQAIRRSYLISLERAVNDRDRSFSLLKSFWWGLRGAQAYSRGWVTPEEINQLVKRDAARLSYQEFLNKHHLSLPEAEYQQDAQTLFDFFDDEIKTSLRPKVIQWLQKKNPTLNDLQTTYRRECLIFNIDSMRFASEELERDFEALLQGTVSYQNLRTKYGLQFLKGEMQHIPFKMIQLRRKLLQEAAQYPNGFCHFLKEYKDDCTWLTLSERDLLPAFCQTEFDFLKTKGAGLGYEHFIERNGKALMTTLAQSEEGRDLLKKEFLEMSIGKMTTAASDNDKLMLGISNEEIKHRFDRDLDNLDYDRFKNKHGLHFLGNATIMNENMASGARSSLLSKLYHELTKAPLEAIKGYLGDLAKLGGSVDQVLKVRYSGWHIVDIINSADSAVFYSFFKERLVNFEEWRAVFLRDFRGASVKDLLETHPQLFEFGIFRPQDGLPAFSTQYLKLIKQMMTWDDFLKQSGLRAINYRLIAKDDPNLIKLMARHIQNALEQNAQQFLADPLSPSQDFLQLLPSALRQHLGTAREEYRRYQLMFRQFQSELEDKKRESYKKLASTLQSEIDLKYHEKSATEKFIKSYKEKEKELNQLKMESQGAAAKQQEIVSNLLPDCENQAQIVQSQLELKKKELRLMTDDSGQKETTLVEQIGQAFKTDPKKTQEKQLQMEMNALMQKMTKLTKLREQCQTEIKRLKELPFRLVQLENELLALTPQFDLAIDTIEELQNAYHSLCLVAQKRLNEEKQKIESNAQATLTNAVLENEKRFSDLKLNLYQNLSPYL